MTYRVKVAMSHTAGVKVIKAVRYQIAGKGISVIRYKGRRAPTKASRFISGLTRIYISKSLQGVKTEMTRRGLRATPRMGTTFGCAKRFHLTTSR